MKYKMQVLYFSKTGNTEKMAQAIGKSVSYTHLDPTGKWPKWLTGALNVVGGALEIVAGAVLGATAGWTGVGEVAAGFLIVNGAATVTQGIGQIINDVTNSNTMREDNIIRTGVQAIGQAIGGDTGAQVAGTAYDLSLIHI